MPDDRLTCSHGCSFTLATAPEVCPHGVGIFGSWARANAAVADAARRVREGDQNMRQRPGPGRTSL